MVHRLTGKQSAVDRNRKPSQPAWARRAWAAKLTNRPVVGNRVHGFQPLTPTHRHTSALTHPLFDRKTLRKHLKFQQYFVFQILAFYNQVSSKHTTLYNFDCFCEIKMNKVCTVFEFSSSRNYQIIKLLCERSKNVERRQKFI